MGQVYIVSSWKLAKARGSGESIQCWVLCGHPQLLLEWCLGAQAAAIGGLIWSRRKMRRECGPTAWFEDLPSARCVLW